MERYQECAQHAAFLRTAGAIHWKGTRNVFKMLLSLGKQAPSIGKVPGHAQIWSRLWKTCGRHGQSLVNVVTALEDVVNIQNFIFFYNFHLFSTSSKISSPVWSRLPQRLPGCLPAFGPLLVSGRDPLEKYQGRHETVGLL